MNLLVLGATGKTGSEIVRVALARRHRVTALVRSPEKMVVKDDLLHIRAGSPLAPAELTKALHGQDAVLSTLGLPGLGALRPSTFMTDAARVTVDAMQRADVSRLSILSAAVLFPGRGLQIAFFKWLLSNHAHDLARMEELVRGSGLTFTIARPPRLVHGDDARYAARADALPAGGLTISFRAVATFMVDAIDQRAHLGEVVGVAATP